MSQTNEETSAIPQMDGALRRIEPPPASRGVVRSTNGEGTLAGHPSPPRHQGDSTVPAQSHPQARMSPGTPQVQTTITVDAATVDTWMKMQGLALLRQQGWQGTDADFYARVEVLRIGSGGVRFLVGD